MYIFIHTNRNGWKFSVFIMFVLLFLTVQNWNSLSLLNCLSAHWISHIHITHKIKHTHTYIRTLHICCIYIMCVYSFFHSMCAKKLHKPNKLIQFAACTEHDREYTFHYFEFVWFKSLFSLFCSRPSLMLSSTIHTHTRPHPYTHIRGHVDADVKFLC